MRFAILDNELFTKKRTKIESNNQIADQVSDSISNDLFQIYVLVYTYNLIYTFSNGSNGLLILIEMKKKCILTVNLEKQKNSNGRP